jgi:mannose-1-phosphate guanylyltransferase
VEVRAVKRFVEKPKRDAAERMVAAGGHYWNAGMFVWRVERLRGARKVLLVGAQDLLDAPHEHAGVPVVAARGDHALRGIPLGLLDEPLDGAHLDGCLDVELVAGLDVPEPRVRALREAIGSPRYESVLAEVWEETDRTTVDYGIAEKAENVAVVPANIGWQDVGSWARFAEIVSKGDNWASGDLVAEDSHGNFVWAPEKTVALIGVEGLVIVDTPDALLITTKERSEDVKTVVDRLKKDEKEDLL